MAQQSLALAEGGVLLDRAARIQAETEAQTAETVITIPTPIGIKRAARWEGTDLLQHAAAVVPRMYRACLPL
jgi:hypothetical protein